MSIFAFICPYQLLTLKKVTFCRHFSRPGPYDPYVHMHAQILIKLFFKHATCVDRLIIKSLKGSIISLKKTSNKLVLRPKF